MRIAISIVRHLLRAVLAAAAIAILIALFLFSYKLPDSILSRISWLRFGKDGTGGIETLYEVITGESESERAETEAAGQTPAPAPAVPMNARLVVPSMAMN